MTRSEAERYTAADYERYRKQQDEKAAKEEQGRNERMEKTTAKRAWMADGGREGDFEKAWPQLRDQGRRQRVLGADKRARQEMYERGISRI